MADSVKSLAKVKVNDTHCSSLIYKSSRFITDDNQVGEARFTLGKCMLAVPDCLLLPVPRKVFQEDMDFHMGCSEADQPTVSLWAFFSKMGTFAFLQSFGTSPSLHDLSKIKVQPCSDTSQLPQHPWMQLS